MNREEAEERTQLIGALEKRGEWISQFHNLFFEMLSADIDKYTSGHHTKKCQSVKYWDTPQDCDCVMGKLLTLLERVEDGELAALSKTRGKG